MTEPKDISIRPVAERFDSGERMPVDKVEIGQWYWVKDTQRYSDSAGGRKVGDEYEWLGCVMAIGSNYVEIHSPRSHHGSYNTERVHFDNFEDRLRYEPDADAVIQRNVAFYQTQVKLLLGEVNELTKRLGVVPAQRVEDKSGEGTNALVAVASQPDTTAYKNALIEAKDKTLPGLFKDIEKANEMMARWMMAPTMATLATIGPMKKSIKHVEDRIYTLSLYAGLSEDAVQIREGATPAREEKLRLMQRRLYMDEECLVNYEAGGMEMKHISKFDEWLARGENFKRLLPFERCAVAFRVRRFEKEREGDTLYQMFINIYLKDEDKTTFLYIRNGDNLWRVNCDFDFGEKLVPDQTEFDPSQPMMVKMFASSVDEIIPLTAWEVMRDEELEKLRLKEEWDVAHPNKEDGIRNPYGWMGVTMHHREYKPFNPSNVYYDEAVEKISDAIKKYNRVAVIVQGLFDRSLVLHPHGPVRIWDPASFARSIEVVYDSTTLTYGEKPDFEAYRADLNALITADSMITGQEDVWLRAEAEKENDRQARDRRNKYKSNYTRYAPYGNPGPGRVSAMADWKPRSGKATFRWKRERRRWDSYASNEIESSITVSVHDLLNVSAYTPGDFKQFFADPRTRREYFKWAPLLLTAEDYHAGKMVPRTHDRSWVTFE